MTICVDTNVLVRAIVQDDIKQCQIARTLLNEAEQIVISLPCLCELVWVLRGIKQARKDIAHTLHTLLDAKNIIMNRPAVRYGLAIHESGGDFADGIMAWEGNALGAQTFVSFDKQAVTLVSQHGQAARLLQ